MQSGKKKLASSQEAAASLPAFDELSTSAITGFPLPPLLDPCKETTAEMRLDDMLAFCPDIPDDDITAYHSDFPENPTVAKLTEQLVASQASSKGLGKVGSARNGLSVMTTTFYTEETEGGAKGASRKRVLRREASLTGYGLKLENVFADSPRTLAMHLLENDVPLANFEEAEPREAISAGATPPLVLPAAAGHGSTGKKARSSSPMGSCDNDTSDEDAGEVLVTTNSSAPGDIPPAPPPRHNNNNNNNTPPPPSTNHDAACSSHTDSFDADNHDDQYGAPSLNMSADTGGGGGANNASFSGGGGESAEDLVMRRRLQNRAASARHRQRIKEREGELVSLRNANAALLSEKEAMAARMEQLEVKLEEARGAAAAAEAASVQRAQEASEQALLYVVGKYWLRQKLHFPTVASCVRGLVSLSLGAQKNRNSSGVDASAIGVDASPPGAGVAGGGGGGTATAAESAPVLDEDEDAAPVRII